MVSGVAQVWRPDSGLSAAWTYAADEQVWLLLLIVLISGAFHPPGLLRHEHKTGFGSINTGVLHAYAYEPKTRIAVFSMEATSVQYF